MKQTLNEITLVEGAHHGINISNIDGVGKGQSCLFGLRIPFGTKLKKKEQTGNFLLIRA